MMVVDFLMIALGVLLALACWRRSSLRLLLAGLLFAVSGYAVGVDRWQAAVFTLLALIVSVVLIAS